MGFLEQQMDPLCLCKAAEINTSIVDIALATTDRYYFPMQRKRWIDSFDTSWKPKSSSNICRIHDLLFYAR